MRQYATYAAGAAIVAALFSVSAKAEPTTEYNGMCAYGLARGMDVPTDCSITWQDPQTKKVYCFSSAGSKAAWAADYANLLVRAENGYRAAAMKAQAKLQAEAQKEKAMEQARAAQGMAARAQADAQRSIGDALKNIPAPPPGAPPMGGGQ